MRVGEFWEINNGRKHSVDNRGSEDRVHLIIDWMPNQTGQPQAALLVSDQHYTEGESSLVYLLNIPHIDIYE